MTGQKNATNVLLVEDSPEFQFLVRKSLEDRFEVTCVGAAEEARQKLAWKNYDLILLDVGLPDGDGFGLCTELRDSARTRDVPILFLTGRSEIQDRVNGFALGADDYIVKPFDPLELKARVEARVRRLAKAGPSSETLVRGDLKLWVAYQKAALTDAGVERDLELTPIEFKLLYTFMRNEGQVVTRTQLLEAVWSEKVHVIDRIIDRHVCSLRQKLTPKSSYIETVPREGYRFMLKGASATG